MKFPKIGTKIVYFNDGYRHYTICRSKEDIKVSTGEIITVINGKYPITNVRPPAEHELETEYSHIKDEELGGNAWSDVIREIQKDKENDIQKVIDYELPPPANQGTKSFIPKEIVLRETKVTEIKEKL